MKFSLPPPQHWQDFQDLTQAVAKRQYPESSVLIYGREGQDQQGIDVYIEGKRIGIQAKNRRLFNANGKIQPNGQIGVEDVKAIAKDAEEFEPTLNKLLIATSALADAKLQKQVILLNEARTNAALFPLSFGSGITSKLKSTIIKIYWISTTKRFYQKCPVSIQTLFY